MNLLSAGLIPIFKTTPSPEFLVLRAYNYWDFPKGLVEKGEDPLAAAIREMEEEAGLTNPSFPWGEVYVETEPYSRGKVARYYLAQVTTQNCILGINPELGRAEHSEFRWLTYNEARKLFVPRLQRVIDWAQEIIG